MARISGHVDPMGRPVVSIISARTGDPFLATVDTGFNGGLLTAKTDAPTLGVRTADTHLEVELGDGRRVLLQRGRLALVWLGTTIEVDAFISDEPSRGGEGRPVALIGALLLSPHLLMVDYGAKTVDIETQD